jgi:group I intron endonuclease
MCTTGDIYLITNKVNGKRYVGQTLSYYSNNLLNGTQNRWKKHVNNTKNKIDSCPILEKAIRKYGKDNFSVETLLTCDIDMLNDFEGRMIMIYGTLVPNGYNILNEGKNGRTHHNLTKEKMSLTRTGKKHSKTTKELIGLKHKGKEITDDHKKQVSSSRRKYLKPEYKKRVNEALDYLELTEMPMYIVYMYDKQCGSDGFRVSHPKYTNKKFMSKKNSIADKLFIAIEYLDNLK